jgi:hypothetical protein
VEVLDWALRCVAHASAAQRLAADENLKQAAGQFADTVEGLLPLLQEAAAE